MTERNWKNFYQVWYKAQGRWLVASTHPNPADMHEAAERGISRNPNYVERIECRDYWGDSVLETVWDRSWL